MRRSSRAPDDDFACHRPSPERRAEERTGRSRQNRPAQSIRPARYRPRGDRCEYSSPNSANDIIEQKTVAIPTTSPVISKAARRPKCCATYRIKIGRTDRPWICPYPKPHPETALSCSCEDVGGLLYRHTVWGTNRHSQASDPPGAAGSTALLRSDLGVRPRRRNSRFRRFPAYQIGQRPHGVSPTAGVENLRGEWD